MLPPSKNMRVLVNGTANGLVLGVLALAFMLVYLPTQVLFLGAAGTCDLGSKTAKLPAWSLPGRSRNRTGVSIPVRLRPGIRYLAAQVMIVPTIFGTRKSMTEPPRFLPIASMSPDLNLSAAIPIKKGVAAIIAVRLLHPIGSDTAHCLCESLVGI